MNEQFLVKYISVKNCFLYFCDRWLEKFKDRNSLVPVLKLDYATSKSGYFSCSPESQNSCDDNSVGISATYAQKLGIKNKERVTVSICANVISLEKINVSPLTQDDWEILEISSNQVQSSLLDQVRVVWSGQILIVWISKSLYLSLHVDNLDSDNHIGLLQPLTDVVVAPLSSVKSLTSIASTEKQSSTTDLKTVVSENADNEIQDLHAGQSFTSNIWTAIKNYIVPGNVKIEEEKLGKNSLGKKLENSINSSIKNCEEKKLPFIFRVHPLCIPSVDNENNVEDQLLLHPYNVFIRKCCLPNLNRFQNGEHEILVCRLVKVPYELNSSDTKYSSKNNDIVKPKDSVVQTMESSDMLYAILYIIEDIYDSLSYCFKEYFDKVTLKERNGHDSLLMSDVARSVLNIKIGSHVNLELIGHASSVSITEVQITALDQWEKNMKELEMLYKTYIANEVKSHPLLINSNAILPVPLKEEKGILNILINISPENMKYAVLNPENVRKYKLTTKEIKTKSLHPDIKENEDNNDNVHNHTLLSNAEDLVLEGVATLELSLNILPLVASLQPSRTNMTIDNILIVGTAGSGKSTLARSICKQLEKPPYFVHWSEIQCKQLKGKKVENLHKHISYSLMECLYHQPSVLILDDLESIAGMESSTPGEENSSQNIYFNRVGEQLVKLLEEFQSSGSMSVIATAPSVLKLNSSLASPRGQHIFKTVLEIAELNKTDRMAILRDILSQRSDVTVDSSSLHWDKFTTRTEGYVLQDIVDFVNKAVFECCKRNVCSPIKENMVTCLTNDDFEEALKSTVPLSQRGVQLYQGDAPSWDDIGGLEDVKEILIEVLQWPSQYPEIFENAPLRHQSGLLLYGAPGTGKTLLAGAVARECGLKFISIKGPELLSKYIGASEEGVRNIFQKAQSAKPCVLFFDEFDSLAPRRGHDSTGVTDRVVNQLLTQLDGVESLYGVWVMAATSRPDLIDPALLRPGRLDRAINCPLPTRADRLSILEALSRKLVLSSDVDFKELADKTEGFTGADLQAVLYTAQLTAVELVISTQDTEKSKLTEDQDSRVKSVDSHSQNEPDECENGRPIITQDNLRSALQNTRPSLSDTEKLKYRLIYEKFVRSRGGTTAEDIALMPQRATLA